MPYSFSVVVDPKSLMFVYGMTLNYRFRATRVGRSASAPAMHAHPRSIAPHGKDQQGCAGDRDRCSGAIEHILRFSSV